MNNVGNGDSKKSGNKVFVVIGAVVAALIVLALVGFGVKTLNDKKAADAAAQQEILDKAEADRIAAEEAKQKESEEETIKEDDEIDGSTLEDDFFTNKIAEDNLEIVNMAEKFGTSGYEFTYDDIYGICSCYSSLDKYENVCPVDERVAIGLEKVDKLVETYTELVGKENGDGDNQIADAIQYDLEYVDGSSAGVAEFKEGSGGSGNTSVAYLAYYDKKVNDESFDMTLSEYLKTLSYDDLCARWGLTVEEAAEMGDFTAYAFGPEENYLAVNLFTAVRLLPTLSQEKYTADFILEAETDTFFGGDGAWIMPIRTENYNTYWAIFDKDNNLLDVDTLLNEWYGSFDNIVYRYIYLE